MLADTPTPELIPMKLHRGLKLPDPKEPKYPFDSLEHGDAIEVESIPGAREMFRRWREKTGRRQTKLISNKVPGFEHYLFFIDAGAESAKKLEPIDDEV
jgi:hypothetical protein